MLQFFMNGGAPMFLVLGCGFAGLIAAIRFAMQPDARKVGAIVSLSVAILAATFTGFASDILAVATHVPKDPALTKPDVFPVVLLQGLGESMSPVILGFALLCVIWVVMAAGYRRLAPRIQG